MDRQRSSLPYQDPSDSTTPQPKQIPELAATVPGGTMGVDVAMTVMLAQDVPGFEKAVLECRDWE